MTCSHQCTHLFQVLNKFLKCFATKKKVSSLFRKLAIFQKMKMKSSYKRKHHTIIYVQKLTKKTDIKIDIGYFVTAIESK